MYSSQSTHKSVYRIRSHVDTQRANDHTLEVKDDTLQTNGRRRLTQVTITWTFYKRGVGGECAFAPNGATNTSVFFLSGVFGDALARGERLDTTDEGEVVTRNVYSLTNDTSDEVVYGGYTHCTHHAGGQLLQKVTTRGVRDESRRTPMGLIGPPERVADGGCRWPPGVQAADGADGARGLPPGAHLGARRGREEHWNTLAGVG